MDEAKVLEALQKYYLDDIALRPPPPQSYT